MTAGPSRLFLPGERSANEKRSQLSQQKATTLQSVNSSSGLFPVAHPTSFSCLQRSPPLCAMGDLHMAHHDCRCPSCNCLLILKKLIFAGEISGSLFCFRSKHCNSLFMTCYLQDYEFSLLLDEWMLWQC